MTKKKVKKIISKTRTRGNNKLRPDDIQYIIELCQEHPRWGVDRIFEEALRPRIRNCLVIPLTPKFKAALEKAAEQYQLNILDVSYHALQEWLEARNLWTTK